MSQPLLRVSLVELEATALGLVEIATMIAECPQGMAEFGGFYYRAPERLGPLISQCRRVFVVHARGKPAGFIDTDRMGDVVDISYFTRPQMRRQGVASSALVALGDALRAERRLTIRAAVAPANAASHGALRSSGFELRDSNGHGQWIYEKHVEPAAADVVSSEQLA